jgi:hypothetical protein
LTWRLYHHSQYNRFAPVNRLTASNRLYRIRERLPRQSMATCGWQPCSIRRTPDDEVVAWCSNRYRRRQPRSTKRNEN